ncbi:MAG: hypothetical protein HY917_05500 [Candidatus Diapherotrites archaeon]|nr:hypothetical protein [Candidatus Diapherotrites archaeon]
MKSKNAVLMIILRNPGIAYDELLSKLAPNYSNINSARAVLSRVLKNFQVMGIVARKENRLFATDKGSVQLASEMKNRLIVKLNQAINAKNKVKEMDPIVQQLATLIARGKEDEGLLKIVRGSTDFFIEDLRQTHQALLKEIEHLKYLESVFLEQIHSLEAFDFNDIRRTELTPAMHRFIEKALEAAPATEIVMESDETLISRLSEPVEAKPKGTKATLSLAQTQKILNRLMSEPAPAKITFYLHPIMLQITGTAITITGPCQLLKKVEENTQH